MVFYHMKKNKLQFEISFKTNFSAERKRKSRNFSEVQTSGCCSRIWKYLKYQHIISVFQLEETELNELQELWTQIMHSQTHLSTERISHVVSVWIVIIYGPILVVLVYYIYINLVPRCRKSSTRLRVVLLLVWWKILRSSNTSLISGLEIWWKLVRWFLQFNVIIWNKWINP